MIIKYIKLIVINIVFFISFQSTFADILIYPKKKPVLSTDVLEKKISKNILIPLKKLVLDSQTPGGTNAFVLKKLKKTKFYQVQLKALNSIFRKF